MPEYVPRLADGVLREMLAVHPAILVVGPRATGKTTTSARSSSSTVSLLHPAQAEAVRADPFVALRERVEPVLIDEWQVVPDVLFALKSLVDLDPRPGRFIVTGSVRGDLDHPTWPGTGRLVRLPMFGLTEREIEHRATRPSWLERVLEGEIGAVRSEVDLKGYLERALRGGFPDSVLLVDDRARTRWLKSYLEQTVTRDAIGLEPRRDPAKLRRYLEALALNSARIVDDATLFEAAGITKVTARGYENLLQNLLIIDKVPAWTSNRLKRLSLASKRFIVDSGLFGAALSLTVSTVLDDGDLLGRLIETFVAAQLRAELALLPNEPRIHHLRTAQGRQEIDFVIEVGPRKLVAIEVKATSAPVAADGRHLRWLRESLGDSVIASIVLHTGGVSYPLDERTIAVPIAALWS